MYLLFVAVILAHYKQLPESANKIRILKKPLCLLKDRSRSRISDRLVIITGFIYFLYFFQEENNIGYFFQISLSN